MTFMSRIRRRMGPAGALICFVLTGCSSSAGSATDGPTLDAASEASSGLELDASPDKALPNDLASDASSCQPPATISYSAPGCGVNAHPNCSAPQLDACAALVYYCGCDGRTVTGGCGWSSQPYLYQGACVDAGSDGAPVDAGSDGAPADGG